MNTQDIDLVSDLNGPEGDIPAHGNAQPVHEIPNDRPEDAARSLRDQISSALKAEDKTPAEASQDGRARDATGKFVAQAPAGTPGEAAQPSPGGEQQPQPGAGAPPAGLDPQVFNSLPAETQVHLARTMEALTTRAAQVEARYSDYERLIAPRRQAYALNGLSEGQAIQQLLALSDFATADPKGFVKYFAQNNNVDLEAMVFDDDDDHNPVDPALAAMQKQVSDMQQLLHNQAQQGEQVRHQQTVQYIANFYQEKSADGTAIRPHADELGSTLTPFVQNVLAQNPGWPMDKVLQEAYDAACWAHPNVRVKMQQSLDAAAEAQRIRDAQQRMQHAQRAGVSVGSGTPSSLEVPSNTGADLRGTIRDAMASLN